jgi:hypothetical protein
MTNVPPFAANMGQYHRRLALLLLLVLQVSTLCCGRVAFGQLPPASADAIATAVARQLPSSSSTILLVPTVNDRIALSPSRPVAVLTEDIAVSLRQRGFAVRTLADAPYGDLAGRSFGSAPGVRAGLQPFAANAGIALLLLLAFAEAQDPPRVMASIYESTGSRFGPIWESHVGWRVERESGPVRADVGSGCTGNLLRNGGFRQDWAVGWQREYGRADMTDPGRGIGASVTEVVQGPDGPMLHLSHRGPSSFSVFQTTMVPRGNLWFQYRAKMIAREGPLIGLSGTGTAAIGLELLGPRQEVLGTLWAGTYVNIWEGMAFAGVPESPRSTSVENFARLPNNETVRNRFDVTKFVRDRMGRVDLDRVAAVRVRISVGANGRDASAELWADSLVLEVCAQ